MSGFFVSWMEVSFKCSKETFNNIVKEFTEQTILDDYSDLTFDYSELDQAGIVSNKDGEVFHDFDEQLVEFNSLCQKHETHIEGYYICNTDDNDSVRVDIDGSKPEAHMFASYGSSWLLNYTVEQIMAIQEKAREMFPKQPTDRSDSCEE